MKFADVKIGVEYLTKISGALVKVRTEGMREIQGRATYMPGATTTYAVKKVFEVVRCDGGNGGRRLWRTAGKLRALP